MNKKILASLIIIGILGFSLGWGTYSYFSDTETSSGNTFSAGTIDLEVNDMNPLEGALVTLKDMKPCEWKYVTVKLHNVGTNPGDAWLHIKDIKESGGKHPEPEKETDPKNEINDIQNWITFDLKLDGKIIIHPDDHIKLGDIECVWIYLGNLKPSTEYTLTMSFHLQAETPNTYQGDYITFTIEFLLNQKGAPDPVSNRILLENKDPNTWEPILGDGIWGIAEYEVGSLTLHVEAHGLSPNTDYQIKLNSPEDAPWYPVDAWTRVAMASALASGEYDGTNPGTAPAEGFNLYERGYWGEGQTMLESEYTTGDIGVWAFTKHGETSNGVTTDENGYFETTKSADLPPGEYMFIKLMVGLDDDPWTVELMEVTPLFFTIEAPPA
jgi:predicted ribosomally synthesized peptide with SipW-like signal peptide